MTIHHHGRTVDVYLDGDVTSKTINNSNYFLSLDPVVYIGGGDNFVLTRGGSYFLHILCTSLCPPSPSPLPLSASANARACPCVCVYVSVSVFDNADLLKIR